MAERALATAFVNIVPGTKDFDSMLKAQLTGKMPGVGADAGGKFNKGFGSAVGKIGGVLTAALGTGAIVGFTKKLIGAAEAEVVGNKRLENIANSMNLFGDNTGAVVKRLQDYATKQQLLNGIDDDAIKLSQAKLLTFSEVGKTADQVGGAFDRATKATIDLAAAGFGTVEDNSVQLGKALQDPIKGISALARSGVTFTAAEKARIKTLVESNKVGEAQNIILSAIETQVGATADATRTGSDRMREGWENLKETVGLALLPTFNTFAQQMNEKIIPAITNFLDGKLPGLISSVKGQLAPAFGQVFQALQVLAPVFLQVAQNLSPLVWMALVNIINALAPLLLGLSQVVASNKELFYGIAIAVGAVVGAYKTFQAVQSIIAVATAIQQGYIAATYGAAGASYATTTAAKVGAVAQQIFSGAIFKTAAAWVANAASTVASKVALVATSVATKAAAAAQWLLNAAMSANPIGLLVIAVAALVAGLVWFFTQTKTGQKIWAGFVSFLSTAWKAIVAGWNNLVAWFGALPGKIGQFFANAGTWLLNAGKNIIDGLLNGLANAGPAIGKWFQNMGKAWIGQFKSLFGIHSPSKVFEGFGKNILQGLKKGLASNEVDKIREQMDKVAKFVTDSFGSKKISASVAKASRAVITKYRTTLVGLAQQREAVIEQLKTATDELQSKIDERLNYISNLASKFGSGLSIVRRSVDQLQIMDAQDAIVAAQKELTDATTEFGASSREATYAALKLAKAQQELDTLSNGTTAAGVMSQLRDRIAANKQLTSLMSRLQEMGISGDLYQQILESGSLELAQSILDGGSAAITELNALAAEANATALKLATDAGNILFNKGIEVAQGVVDGLKAKEAEIVAQIKVWSDAFVNAITAALQGLEIPAAPDAPAAKTPAGKTPAKTPAAKKPAPKTPAKPAPAKTVTSKATATARAAVGKGIPKFAAGGFVKQPTVGLIGEAGPEVVTPLKDFERMMKLTDAAGGQTVNYYAAPNQSLDAEQALFQAIKRAKVIAQW